jgi:hypothetical protein
VNEPPACDRLQPVAQDLLEIDARAEALGLPCSQYLALVACKDKMLYQHYNLWSPNESA